MFYITLFYIIFVLFPKNHNKNQSNSSTKISLKFGRIRKFQTTKISNQNQSSFFFHTQKKERKSVLFLHFKSTQTFLLQISLQKNKIRKNRIFNSKKQNFLIFPIIRQIFQIYQNSLKFIFPKFSYFFFYFSKNFTNK